MKYDLKELRDEARGYKDFDFSGKPIFIPTKVVRVQAHGITTFGLLRPKLTVIKDLTKKVPSAAKRLMTDSKLLKLYTDLVSLTHQGYAFHDGLQLGLDKAGRALVYDLGDTKRYPPSSNIPYNTNNTKWINLLEDLGKSLAKLKNILKLRGLNMCDLKIIMVINDEQTQIMNDVVKIITDGDSISLIGIFGDTKIVKGVLKQIDTTSSEAIIIGVKNDS